MGDLQALNNIVSRQWNIYLSILICQGSVRGIIVDDLQSSQTIWPVRATECVPGIVSKGALGDEGGHFSTAL